MDHPADSTAKLCQGGKGRYVGREGIPMDNKKSDAGIATRWYVTLYIIMSRLSMRRWSKGRHIRSFNIAVTLEVYLESLVAHLVALLWTASTLFISVVVWGYQTVEVYSN